MSRIAKKPIVIPEKTEVAVSGGVITVRGPLGVLTRDAHPLISIEVADKSIILKPVRETLDAKMLWGTYASHVKNMLRGVHEAYSKKLIIEGIGYKADVKGSDLTLALGFSHPVKVKVPEGLKVIMEKNLMTISGINKELVGEFAARIRDLKKPEPYKGKGIRYHDEIIRRKEGKKTA